MANSRNPNNNSILQALIDLSDSGFAAMADPIITKISGDRKLQKDLQAKWDAHAYPEKSMVYAQLTITQALMDLSPQACKVLLLLGSYASLTGLVQVSYPTLETVTGIKRTMVREAVQELKDHGLIRIRVKPARHEPPIYCIDPGVIVIKFQKFDGCLRAHNATSQVDHDTDTIAAVCPDDSVLNPHGICSDTSVLHSAACYDGGVRSSHLGCELPYSLRSQPAVGDNYDSDHGCSSCPFVLPEKTSGINLI